ncbi:hypothetical protein [Chryseobacterium sp. CH21]|uniref:hypothetical protein n=1 Tax=Chryseobacterium sp. CH21 TaxID=713556 RepID=UPI001E65242E|nr:hypothetical protein [Chryseobacterium sp. CH21]
MELGIGMFGDLALDQSTGKYRDAGIKIREILDQVKFMDEVGIDVFAMGEHHRPDYAVSSPEIVLARPRVLQKYQTGQWSYCFKFFGAGKSI